jgi:hypothetical protein
VLIESLRKRRNVNSRELRYILTEQFLHEAIPSVDLLKEFLQELPLDMNEKSYLELNDNALERLTGAYKTVFPTMSKLIDERYVELCNMMFSINKQPADNCSHDWEEIFVHKIGHRYLCRKCDAIVQSVSGS